MELLIWLPHIFLTLQEYIIYIIEKRVMLLVYISTANTSTVLSLSAGVS